MQRSSCHQHKRKRPESVCAGMLPPSELASLCYSGAMWLCWLLSTSLSLVSGLQLSIAFRRHLSHSREGHVVTNVGNIKHCEWKRAERSAPQRKVSALLSGQSLSGHWRHLLTASAAVCSSSDLQLGIAARSRMLSMMHFDANLKRSYAYHSSLAVASCGGLSLHLPVLLQVSRTCGLRLLRRPRTKLL